MVLFKASRDNGAGLISSTCFAMLIASQKGSTSDIKDLFILLLEASIEYKRSVRKLEAQLKSKFIDLKVIRNLFRSEFSRATESYYSTIWLSNSLQQGYGPFSLFKTRTRP